VVALLVGPSLELVCPHVRRGSPDPADGSTEGLPAQGITERGGTVGRPCPNGGVSFVGHGAEVDFIGLPAERASR